LFTFPVVVTLTSASGAQTVAKAACALPDVPKGIRHCPEAYALYYHLVFAVRGEKGTGGEAINVYPTGCPSVTGLGAVRTTALDEGFYRVLGQAMGLTSANYLTFRGTFRAGS
jgi:hypothetical protein